MAINGNQIILKKYVNNQWQTIGYIRSQEPTTQADMLEVSNVYIEGYAFIDTVKITMTRGNIIQGSFHFTGTGALTMPQ